MLCSHWYGGIKFYKLDRIVLSHITWGRKEEGDASAAVPYERV